MLSEKPTNEPVLEYLKGNPETVELKSELARLKAREIEIPLIIGGKEIKTDKVLEIRIPHNTKHLLGRYHLAGEQEIDLAIEAALKAKDGWLERSWEDRAEIFNKAANLLAGKWRATLNATTMLGQSKTFHEAEIDTVEIIDFWRFNVYYALNLIQAQPFSPDKNVKNQLEYRPLEGFVFAVSPFNFTSIGANLPTAPAIMGNVVLWKPASNSVYSNYFIMKVLEDARFPPGVINFIPGPGSVVGPHVMKHREFSALHFTGSTSTLHSIWHFITRNLSTYKNMPRIVGETGGKGFVVVHSSADIDEVMAGLIRGAFGYQGQKCSAVTRAYIPKSTWPKIRRVLLTNLTTVKVGDIEDPETFMGAIIDKKAFDKIKAYLDYAKSTPNTNEIIFGGKIDSTKGYFVEPTVIVTTTPKCKLMEEEIFGPILTCFVYPDNDFLDILDLVDTTSPYGLTGAIFAKDQVIIEKTKTRLRYSAGNFYINDKPTGAVVGQQPFGGARGSGTNDKAGSHLNLIRWVSPRAIKENYAPPRDYAYKYMME